MHTIHPAEAVLLHFGGLKMAVARGGHLKRVGYEDGCHFISHLRTEDGHWDLYEDG